MIIRNKKTEIETVVTPEEWEAIKNNGYETKFRIVSEAKEILGNKNSMPLAEVQEFKVIKEKQTNKAK